MRRSVLCSVALASAMAAVAAGQQPEQLALLQLYLKNGEPVDLTVIGVENGTVVLTHGDVTGSRAVLPFSELSEFSVYELRLATMDASSPAAHEELGDWAVENGLHELAVQRYRTARNLHGASAPARLEEKLVRATERSLEERLDRSRWLVEEGRLAEARGVLARIVEEHPLTDEAEAARIGIAEIEPLIAAERALRQERLRPPAGRAFDERLDAVARWIERGDRHRTDAFLEAGSLPAAQSQFEAAIDAYRRALRAADAIESPQDRARASELAELRQRAENRLADSYVDLASNYLTRGSPLRANHFVGLALALDPNHLRALSLRETIGLSASSGGVVVGVRPPQVRPTRRQPPRVIRRIP